MNSPRFDSPFVLLSLSSQQSPTDPLLGKDAFLIVCTIVYSPTPPSPPPLPRLLIPKDLVTAYASLFDDADYSDIVFRIRPSGKPERRERRIYAMRKVLAGRCEYFEDSEFGSSALFLIPLRPDPFFNNFKCSPPASTNPPPTPRPPKRNPPQPPPPLVPDSPPSRSLPPKPPSQTTTMMIGMRTTIRMWRRIMRTKKWRARRREVMRRWERDREDGRRGRGLARRRFRMTRRRSRRSRRIRRAPMKELESRRPIGGGALHPRRPLSTPPSRPSRLPSPRGSPHRLGRPRRMRRV